MSYRIFISYYSEERPIAEALKEILTQAYVGHADVFISFDVPKGMDWLQNIKNKLND